jgi:hypothetical protein
MATSGELLVDMKALTRLQHYYWVLEKSATPSALLLPWFPGPSKIRRLLALKNLYLDLLKFVERRRAATVPNSDAIDFMLAQGKTNEEVIGVCNFLIVCCNANQMFTVRAWSRLRGCP